MLSGGIGKLDVDGEMAVWCLNGYSIQPHIVELYGSLQQCKLLCVIYCGIYLSLSVCHELYCCRLTRCDDPCTSQTVDVIAMLDPLTTVYSRITMLNYWTCPSTI